MSEVEHHGSKFLAKPSQWATVKRDEQRQAYLAYSSCSLKLCHTEQQRDSTAPVLCRYVFHFDMRGPDTDSVGGLQSVNR